MAIDLVEFATGVGAVVAAIAAAVITTVRQLRKETRPTDSEGVRNGQRSGEMLQEMAIMLAEIQHQTQQNTDDIRKITDIIDRRIRVSGTNDALKKLIEWADQKMKEEGKT